jgi:hypothetical protein
MKTFFAFSLAIVLAISSHCPGKPSLEKTAYETIVAAKAFLDSVKLAHPECSLVGVTSLPMNSPTCLKLQRAIAAKDALIDAEIVYCSGIAFNNGGACSPPAKNSPIFVQVRSRLDAALSLYSQAAADLKGLT